MSSSAYFLQEMAYPPYCIQPLKSWGMVAVGGGGGTAKTGVGNAVDLKWIYLCEPSDPKNMKCSIQNVNSFSQHDSVMRMVSLRKQHEYLILALNRHLKVIMLTAAQRDLDSGTIIDYSPSPPTSLSSSSLSVPKSIRRRRSSSAVDTGNSRQRATSAIQRNVQATVDAIGNETTIAITPASVTPTTCTTSFVLPLTVSAFMTDSNIYTVPIQEQEYVNALAICPATQSKLFVGASDGSLQVYEIIWPASSSSDRLLQLNLLTSFTTHSKEIDDLAVDPFGTWLISVSRDHHVQIRQCSSPFDKHCELDLCQFGTNKSSTPPKPLYRIRHVRFGFDTTSSKTKSFLYTSLVPLSIVDKLVSYIIQWSENRQHEFLVRQRRAVSQARISATAVSNCGQYVSVGDSDGCVRIYDSNGLILLYEHRSHSIFVTDLAFIRHEENYLYQTSVLSISADKNLYVHNVHLPEKSLFSASIFLVIGLLFFFLSFAQIRFTFH